MKKYSYAFRVLPYFKHHFGKIIFVLFVSVLTMILSLVPIELFKRLIDVAIPNKDIHQVFIIVGAVFGIHLILLLTNYLQDLVLTKLNMKITRHIQTDFFSGILWLASKKSLKYNQGQLMERMIDDAGEAVDSTFDLILSPILEVVSLIVVLVYMFVISPRLALLSIAFVPLFIILILPLNKKVRKRYSQVKNMSAQIYAVIQKKLSEIIFNENITDKDSTNKDSIKEMDKHLKKAYDVEYDYEKFSLKVNGMISIVSDIAPYIVLLYAAYEIIQGRFQIGTLVAFSMLIPRFFEPIQGLAQNEFEFQTMEVIGKRVFSLNKKNKKVKIILKK